MTKKITLLSIESQTYTVKVKMVNLTESQLSLLLQQIVLLKATQLFLVVCVYVHLSFSATLNAIAGDEYEDVSLKEYSSFEVRMGTFLSRGSHYWEAKITVSQPQTPHNHCACKTGLLQVGFSWGSPGITSWYVGAQYRSQQFSSYSVSDYEEVSPDYQAWINVTWPHVLGFSLDWPERVLKVFDRAQGKLVCTIRNVNLKKPVVPAVRLELSSKGSVSVDMAEMEYHSLPDDILQLIYAD